MRLQKKFKVLALPLLLITAVNSWAAGLGGIDLDSFLGQPLTARIQLLGVPVDQVSTVSARLASAGDYRIMGLDQSKLNVPLTFTPAVWRGKTVIEVRSTNAVKDPILQFAIDVSWQHGHLLREYTLFLDPPTVAVAPPRKTNPAKSADPSSSRSAMTNTINGSQAGLSTNAVKKPAVQTILSTGAQSQAGEYGPVRSGDTLWTIANNWSRQTNASVNQAMVAIVRLNPEDFINGDINRMNRGAILRLPTAEDIANISTQEANSIVSQQVSAWHEQVSQTTAPPMLSEEAEEPRADTTQLESAEVIPKAAPTKQPVEIKDDALARIADDRLEPVEPIEETADEILNDAVAEINSNGISNAGSGDEAESGGLLELVPPAEDEMAELDRRLPGSAAGNDAQDTAATIKLENRLAVTEEDLVATQEQNAVLQAQVSKMQAQIDALRDGLNLNDNELAAMQQQMAVTGADADIENSSRSDMPRQGTRMLNKDDKSLLQSWWWLGLLVLAASIGFLVYRNRNNASTESQSETNFLDTMLENKQSREFKTGDKAEEESLAADAEKILEVLEQGDAEVAEQLNDAAEIDTKELSRDAASEAEAEAAEIRKFLDQVEADKAALVERSEDALDHTEDSSVAEQQADSNSESSAEKEVLDSLESDDDSESEQVMGDSAEEQIEVKLDLARAYLAMEDKPAARSILDEIIQLGSEQQQLEARSMLDEIE